MVVKVKKEAKRKRPAPTKRTIKKERIAKSPTIRPVSILTGDDWREGLSHKQALFVEEYLVDLNPAGAARRAGYSPNCAAQTGAALLTSKSVANAIDTALAKGASVTRPRIIQELARIAFANAGDYFEWSDKGIKIKHSNTLTDDQRAAVCEVRQTASKGEITSVSVRFSDKMAALDKLARITRLLKTETLEVTGANGSPLVPEGATTRDIAEAVLGVLNATKPRPAAYMGDLRAIEDKHDTTE